MAIRAMPSGREGQRHVGGEGEDAVGARADGPAACPQPPVRQGAREGRARLPRHEMPVRLPQGALSRHRHERSAGVLAVSARQSVPGPQDACVRITGPRRPARHRRGANFADKSTVQHRGWSQARVAQRFPSREILLGWDVLDSLLVVVRSGSDTSLAGAVVDDRSHRDVARASPRPGASVLDEPASRSRWQLLDPTIAASCGTPHGRSRRSVLSKRSRPWSVGCALWCACSFLNGQVELVLVRPPACCRTRCRDRVSSSRSPTSSSLAADLRPREGKTGSSGLFQRLASGPSAAIPGKPPTTLIPQNDGYAVQTFLSCLDQLLRPCLSHVLGLTSTNNTQRPASSWASVSTRGQACRCAHRAGASPSISLLCHRVLPLRSTLPGYKPLILLCRSSYCVVQTIRPVTPLAVGDCSVADRSRP